MNDKLKILDLFAGIGGFSLGLEATGGFETVAFCEIEPYPCAVLKKHWPDVPVFNDVRSLTADDVGPVHIITGGYPCQPFSLAGKRRGAEDDRHLWPEMARLIRQLHPSWVIAENVAGHINMGLDQVLSDLEGEGYTCWPLVIPACAVDAPHRRDRVWIVAHAGHPIRRRGVGRQQSRNGQLGVHGTHRETVADADRASSQGGRIPSRIHSEHADADSGSDGIGRQTSLQWPPEPGVGRVANGIPKRVDRLKCLGNSIVPQIVTQIGYAILQAEGQVT